MSKRTVIVALAALAMISVSALALRPASVKRVAEMQPPAAKATAGAITGDAVKPEAVLIADGVSHPVPADITVYDAMEQLGNSGTLSFTGEEYPSLGFFVESIGGKKNADGNYWILYVNGTSSSLGASATQIHTGDTIEWRYEKNY